MPKKPHKGMFIVLEGLDGSGLSTQSGFLKKYFENKGYEVVATKEPTRQSEWGKKINRVLDKEESVTPAELQKLFVKDRRWHLENVILPAIEEGKIVISDRYLFSTIAFGSIACDFDWLVEINKNFPLPDATFIIKVGPEMCLDRIGKRGEGFKHFERLESLSKSLEAYLKMPELFEKVYLVNGEPAKERVFEDIKTLLRKNFVFLKKNKKNN